MSVLRARRFFFATTQNFWWYFSPWVAMTPCGLVRGGILVDFLLREAEPLRTDEQF